MMKINIKQLIPWIFLVLIVGGLSIWYFLNQRVSEEEKSTYEQKVQEADTMLESREYSTALGIYYNAVEIIPSRSEAFSGIVDILISKNRLEDAKGVLDKSGGKVNNYDQSILYTKIAQAYFSVGKYDEALKILKVVNSLGQDNSNADILIAKTNFKLGKLDDAQGYLDKKFEGENLSEAKLLKSYKEAITNVETAKSTLSGLTPTDKWKPYFEEFTAVLNSLNTDSKYNATKLSRVYINNGYPFLALQVLSPLETEMNEYLEGTYFLGRAYFDFKEYDKAIVSLDRALSLGGLESDIFWTKARTNVMKNDLDGAITSYGKAVEYSGESVSEVLVSEYLDILLKNDQGLKANEVLQKLSGYIKQPYLMIYGVEISHKLNDSKKVDYYLSLLAKETLTEEIKKEYLSWKVSIALEQNVDISNVQGTIEELLSIDRFFAKGYVLLGQLQFQQGLFEDAKNSLKKAIEYDLDNSATESATQLLSRID